MQRGVSSSSFRVQAPALLRHRIRVIRRVLPSLFALHSNLQALLMNHPSVNITLPPFPDAFELRDFEERYLTTTKSGVFSLSIGQASELKGATASACHSIQTYLSAVVAFQDCLAAESGVAGVGEREGGQGNLSPTTTEQDPCVEVIRIVQDFFACDKYPDNTPIDDLVIDWKTERAVEAVTSSARDEMFRGQKGRCRGCGGVLSTAYFGAQKNYMTCRYLGQLFCTNRCGGDDKAALPCDVIRNWDFSRKKVSTLTASYLRQLSTRPVIRLSSLNPIVAQHKPLQYVRKLREQLNDLRGVMDRSQCPIAHDILSDLVQR